MCMKKASVFLLFLYFAFYVQGACVNEDVRLYSLNTLSVVTDNGIVQICQNGQWVAVCDYRWTQTHSIVFCKQIGYNDPTPITQYNSGYWNRIGFIPIFCSSSYDNITDCVSSYYYHDYFCENYRDTVNIRCNVSTSRCTYRQIRLYNTATNNSGNSGMLQLCDNTGQWTAVCDYSWTCNNAIVACRQLGYYDLRPKYSYNGEPWTKIGFGPYRCYSSSFLSLFSCSQYSSNYRYSTSYCDPSKDTVTLQCSSSRVNNSCSPNSKVKLVGGQSSNEGTIQICYNGQWYSICSGTYVDRYFGSTVCNQLGFITSSFATLIKDGRYGNETSDFFLSYISCGRVRQTIRPCYLYQTNQCNNYGCNYKLGLKCYRPGGCNEGDVHLVNGTLTREGRLEVCVRGVWGRVCASNFRKSAAYIACKQAGFHDVNGAVIDYNGKYGTGDQPIVYSNVDCFGHEQSLSKCSKLVYPNFTCYYNNYIIGLMCLDNCTEGDVRLVGGTHDFQGTVQICLDSVWCLVAQNAWDDNDARIVCKQLKRYNPSAGKAVLNSTYGHPRRAIRYSNVHCQGHEDKLADCAHHTLQFDAGRTYQSEVAGVDCHVMMSQVQSIMVSPSSTTLSINNVLPLPSQQPQSTKQTNGVLISGVLFLIIGIIFVVVGIVLLTFIAVRMRKFSISKAGSYDESRNMTPRATNVLSVKCDESDETYIEVQESSPAKAVVFPNIDTEN